MGDLQKCAASPCKSCPYRRDVPSGVWDASEYEKLPSYDGEIVDQLLADATKLFDCHQRDGHLCAGWVAAHGATNLLAVRIHGETLDVSIFDYRSPVPVFATGREACAHGKRDIEQPGPRAVRMATRLITKLEERPMTKKIDHNSAKTHCPHGHPYEGDNLITMIVKKDGVPTGKTKRQCLKCKQLSHPRKKPLAGDNASGSLGGSDSSPAIGGRSTGPSVVGPLLAGSNRAIVSSTE